ncbi:MAG: hypothetical protein JSR40_19465 [Proteobacteria bacterium]|nr:hypothetical protein [Pseudomonadota bacterium]
MKPPKVPVEDPLRTMQRDAVPLFAYSGRSGGHMRLMTLAMPVMANLYQQFASPSLEVLLANRDGEILRIIGTAAERQSGNGAPALSLAAPIHGTDGCLLILTDHASTSREKCDHMQAVLQTTVEMIEHRLVETDERGFLRLHFHTRQALLGGPLEALAVFDQDSRFVAVNRTAAALLSLGGSLAHLRCADCFDVQWLNLVGYASLHLAAPFPLRTCAGAHVFARSTLSQGIA